MRLIPLWIVLSACGSSEAAAPSDLDLEPVGGPEVVAKAEAVDEPEAMDFDEEGEADLVVAPRARPRRVIRPTAKVVRERPPEPEEPGLPKRIDAGVSQYASQLEACTELARRDDPSLAGRVEVAITVRGGRVSGTDVVANSTDNDELGTCMQRRIRRWQFDESVDGSLVWPFVFRGR